MNISDQIIFTGFFTFEKDKKVSELLPDSGNYASKRKINSSRFPNKIGRIYGLWKTISVSRFGDFKRYLSLWSCKYLFLKSGAWQLYSERDKTVNGFSGRDAFFGAWTIVKSNGSAPQIAFRSALKELTELPLVEYKRKKRWKDILSIKRKCN